MEGAKLTECL